MENKTSAVLLRKGVPTHRHYSYSNSPSGSNAQLNLKQLRILQRPSHKRYTRSTRINREDTSQDIRKKNDFPQYVMSTDLQLRQRIRDRSYYAMKSQLPIKLNLAKLGNLTPVMPSKESYEKISKQLQATKDRSIFHTKDIESEQCELEQLFYQQVRFLQKCKSLAKQSK